MRPFKNTNVEDNSYRHILPGDDYEKYFSRPTGINEDIKRGSELKDTIAFLPHAIHRSKHQVKAFCKTIKSNDVYGICSELWHWLYKHIRYHKDDKGKEQIRSPRRSFYDRERGIDCDDYTVFVSACLCELNIPHVLRIAKYKEANGFQHIYPIVPTQDGKYITVDCVVNRFNFEVPPIETIDKAMDLQFLDGIDNERPRSEMNGVDADDLLMGYEDMGDLGKRLRDTKFAKKVKTTLKKVGQSKVYNKIRKGVHAINRFNPATALLRAGILASLKLNLLKVSSQLRYGYLSPEQAKAKNFDMDKFNRLVGVKNRLQKIFYGAGGKEENFKKAILTGKGNHDKEVMAGLGAIDQNSYSLDNDLSQILGIDSYDSEMQGVEGIEGLGEPATGAAIAAATSVMAAIAGLLKGIGNLRKKPQSSGNDSSDSSNGNNNSASSDSSNSSSDTPSGDTSASDSSSNNSASSDTPTSDTSSNSTSSTDSNQDTSDNANAGVDNSSGSNTTETPAETSNTTDANSSDTSDESATTQNARGESSAVAKATEVSTLVKIKTWVKANPVATGAIALAAASLLTWAVVAYSKKAKKSKESKRDGNVSGFSKRKKHKQHHHKQHSTKSYYPIKIQKLK